MGEILSASVFWVLHQALWGNRIEIYFKALAPRSLKSRHIHEICGTISLGRGISKERPKKQEKSQQAGTFTMDTNEGLSELKGIGTYLQVEGQHWPKLARQ